MRDIIVIRGKCTFKTAKGHQFKEKERKRKEKRERRWRIRLERGVQNLEETIIFRWPYLQNPPLDHADVLIYCSSHTPLLTDRGDLKEHNPSSEHFWKTKGNNSAQQFWSLADFSHSTVGSCSFLDMWCAQMLPSFWMVEIGKYCSGKVSCMLNSISPIFR